MNGMSAGVESIQNMGLGPNVTLITLNSEGLFRQIYGVRPDIVKTLFAVKCIEE